MDSIKVQERAQCLLYLEVVKCMGCWEGGGRAKAQLWLHQSFFPFYVVV